MYPLLDICTALTNSNYMPSLHARVLSSQNIKANKSKCATEHNEKNCFKKISVNKSEQKTMQNLVTINLIKQCYKKFRSIREQSEQNYFFKENVGRKGSTRKIPPIRDLWLCGIRSHVIGVCIYRDIFCTQEIGGRGCSYRIFNGRQKNVCSSDIDIFSRQVSQREIGKKFYNRLYLFSWVSGITVLGNPTEMYFYGTKYMFVCIGIILTGVASAFVFLPVFHEMELSSTYEVNN